MSAERWKRPKTRALILLGLEPAWLVRHPRRQYVRAAILATPPWCTRAMLIRTTIHRRADEVMDHIVPLTHPFVCGLNVPWNLQRLPKATNARKLNAWHPDQLDLLFENQMRLL